MATLPKRLFSLKEILVEKRSLHMELHGDDIRIDHSRNVIKALKTLNENFTIVHGTILQIPLFAFNLTEWIEIAMKCKPEDYPLGPDPINHVFVVDEY